MADAFFEELVTMDVPKGAGNVNSVPCWRRSWRRENDLSNSKSSGKDEPFN